MNTSVKVHAPGIYFGLDEEVYHADPSIGSTDLKKLLQSPADYWWHSGMNPLKPEHKQTKALTRGSALHDLILLGENLFLERYRKLPRSEEFENLLTTASDIKEVLKAEGLPVTGNKPELIERYREFGGKNPIWDEIVQQFNDELAKAGATPLDPDTYDNLMLSGAMINKNPHLRNAFTGGEPEVSLFWQRNGVPCKGRIDYLKPRANVELKSFSNSMGREINNAIKRAIADRRYDLQASHYLYGRALVPGFIKDGRVHGEPPESLLDALTKANDFTCVWVFYQAEGAPLSKGFIYPFQGYYHECAAGEVEHALGLYKSCLERFGTGMWVVDDPLETIQQGDLPPWIGN